MSSQGRLLNPPTVRILYFSPSIFHHLLQIIAVLLLLAISRKRIYQSWAFSDPPDIDHKFETKSLSHHPCKKVKTVKGLSHDRCKKSAILEWKYWQRGRKRCVQEMDRGRFPSRTENHFVVTSLSLSSFPFVITTNHDHEQLVLWFCEWYFSENISPPICVIWIFEAITIFQSALFHFHAQTFLVFWMENIRIDGDIIDIIWGYLLI